MSPYPRQLIDHHLIGGLRMHTAIMYIKLKAQGITNVILGGPGGFRLFKTEKWITNELDCYRLYPKSGFARVGKRIRRLSKKVVH